MIDFFFRSSSLLNLLIYGEAFEICVWPGSLERNLSFSTVQETYYDMLVKYKSDLSRPFHEATTFLNSIETQLSNLCKGDPFSLSLSTESFLVMRKWDSIHIYGFG